MAPQALNKIKTKITSGVNSITDKLGNKKGKGDKSAPLKKITDKLHLSKKGKTPAPGENKLKSLANRIFKTTNNKTRSTTPIACQRNDAKKNSDLSLNEKKTAKSGPSFGVRRDENDVHSSVSFKSIHGETHLDDEIEGENSTTFKSVY
jgi:hypothetical protein